MSSDEDFAMSPAKSPPKIKKKNVADTYQKKTQLEHIILRPDTYIGSVESVSQEMWVYDIEAKKLVFRKVRYVPGLYKIFDEILVNAADNKQRDPKMNKIEVTIDVEKNRVSIWNNGKGVPVEMHDKYKVFVPTMIFGELLTSSNYDDEEKKVTGGRNGYGAKLCNIFSTKFTVKTSSSDSEKKFEQHWSGNMGATTEPKISDFSKNGKDFTEVIFEPDLKKFGMKELDKDIVDLMSRRAYDMAGTLSGVSVYLNKEKLEFKDFKGYAELYIQDQVNEQGMPLAMVSMSGGPRWQIAVTTSDTGFQQVSFVNSIATTKGGRHVDYITDQVVKSLSGVINRKNKSGIDIKPFQIKNHLWVFVNCAIENPTFDSQTKETMTLQIKKFGSKCEITDKFAADIQKKCGVVENILAFAKAKADTQLNKKVHGTKSSKLRNIPKLEDANDAGTKHSNDCTLILTEGDSAKALAVSGFSIVGRDKYGVFPLRGKLLNVRDATPKALMDNAEINNVVKILGLQFKKKYDTEQERKSLRYGKLMIMTDQDQDGSHIKGLLINFIHHYWPNLLRHPFLEQFITPIVKAKKGQVSESFYSLPEFEKWKGETADWHKYHIKYYKGLGTSTSQEAKEYFTDMRRHRIDFKYSGSKDDDCIELAFSKSKADARKEWLTKGMAERKELRELNRGEVYLYQKDTKTVTYSDFVNKELILFSNMDNERSIPSMVDGLKPGQRKVLFTCIKRNDKREVKVAQLAGSVAELSAYHHGEQSLMSTIVGLAQDFVGSNNVNLLMPKGQFGTRLQGGKDSASPRYIFTNLSPLAKAIFSKDDSPLLNFYREENQKIEPEWYMPIVPLVLVNGAEGIGTGWMTKIPNYNPRDIVTNLRRMMKNEPVVPMSPWYKGFRGDIKPLDRDRIVWSGEVAVLDDDNSIEITELPVRCWTQVYKESVIEPMLLGSEKNGKVKPPQIMDYREYHTDTTVRFVIKMSKEKFKEFQDVGFHRAFKLQQTFSLTSMVLFDSKGCIRRYDTVEEILKEFFVLRLEYYGKRKVYKEAELTAEAEKLDDRARFILEKIEGKIHIENVKKVNMIQELITRGFKSDPVKAWKKKAGADTEEAEPVTGEDDEAKPAKAAETGPDYDYLLGMPLWSLTRERKDELIKQRDEKKVELESLKKKSPEDLWNADLDVFMERLDEADAEADEIDERPGSAVKPKVAKLKGKGKKGAPISKADTKPSKNATRVEPVIDAAMLLKFEKAKEAKERKATGEPPKRGGRKKLDAEENADVEENGEVAKMENGSVEKPTSSKAATKKKLTAPAPAGKHFTQTTLDSKVNKSKKKESSFDSTDFSDSEEESVVCDDDSEDEPPPPKKSRKAVKDESDDEDFSEEQLPTKKRTAPAKVEDGEVVDDRSGSDEVAVPASKNKRPVVKDDSDDEYTSPPAKSAPKSVTNGKPKETMDEPVAKVAVTKTVVTKTKPEVKLQVKKAATPRSPTKIVSLVSSDSDEDSVAVKAPPKKVSAPVSKAGGSKPAKPAAKKITKRAAASSGSDNDDFQPSTSAKSDSGKKAKVEAKKKENFADSDSDEIVAPKVRPGRVVVAKRIAIVDLDSDEEMGSGVDYLNSIE